MTDDEATLERFRVHELLGRYVDTLNHRDWARYAECWTEDGVLTMIFAGNDSAPSDDIPDPAKPANLRVVGRQAILDLVATYNRTDLNPWLFQIPTGVAVELTGPATAQIRHTLVVNSHANMQIGIFYDRAVREGDGVWRLTHRDYRPSYAEPMQRTGQVYRTMPDPDYRSLP